MTPERGFVCLNIVYCRTSEFCYDVITHTNTSKRISPRLSVILWSLGLQFFPWLCSPQSECRSITVLLCRTHSTTMVALGGIKSGLYYEIARRGRESWNSDARMQLLRLVSKCSVSRGAQNHSAMHAIQSPEESHHSWAQCLPAK